MEPCFDNKGNKMNESFKKNWIYLLAFFFLVMGLFYYGRSFAQDHYSYDKKGEIYFFEHPLAIKHMDIHLEDYMEDLYSNTHTIKYSPRSLTYDECKTNADKVQFHKENGYRCYDDAKERSWWLPYIEDRAKARYCFTSLGILASPGDPKSKIIITVITALIQYGIDSSDEWSYIDNKLYWSQYHFEMMEFHEHLIRQGYP